MKKWIIAAVILMVLGGAVFMLSFVAADFDFLVIDTETLTEKTYEINGPIQNIEIEDDRGDVRFVLDDTGRVECQESQFVRYSVSMENNTLRIRAVDQRKWYHYLGFFFSDRTVTVFLPADSYQTLSLETDTGDVSIPSGFTFRSAELSTDTGDISFGASVRDTLKCGTDTGDLNLNRVECADLSLETDTGDLLLTRVFCRKGLSVETDTGDVTFDACDGATVTVNTDTGDVEGTFRTDKIFRVSSKSGSVKVPSSAEGGLCSVSTKTGDVNLKIESEG